MALAVQDAEPGSGANWGRSKGRSKAQRPLGRVCPDPQMKTSKGTHICLPIQLLSLSESAGSDHSLGCILLYSREVTYQLEIRLHISKTPFFCSSWPKRLIPLGFPGWPAFLAPFACGRRVHQTKKAPEILLSKNGSIRLNPMKLLPCTGFILQIADL